MYVVARGALGSSPGEFTAKDNNPNRPSLSGTGQAYARGGDGESRTYGPRRWHREIDEDTGRKPDPGSAGCGSSTAMEVCGFAKRDSRNRSTYLCKSMKYSAYTQLGTAAHVPRAR